MGVLHLRQHVYARWSKRVFDILVASIGLLLVAPLLPVIAFLVWRTDGPIDLPADAARRGRTALHRLQVPDDGLRCGGSPTGRSGQPSATSGPRRWAASSVGRTWTRFLQLWNVLKGDMSMVGPRPERPEFVAMLEASTPFWSRRLLIKPGVTGWAQIRCGYAADCEASADKLSYDLWYIRHRNLAVDVAVCLETAGLMVSALCSSAAPSPTGHSPGP